MSDFTLTVEYETVIFPQIAKSVEDALRIEVASKCVNLITESARVNMYDKYVSHAASPYERRGSYLNSDNYTTDVNGNTLTISEEIHGQGKALNLTEALEEGTSYEWTKSEIYAMQPFPRPFFGKAIDDGIASGEIEAALRNGLTRNGF